MKLNLRYERIRENIIFIHVFQYKKIIAILLFAVFSAVVGIVSFNLMLAPASTSDEYYIKYEVKSGSSSKQVANEMCEMGLIKNALAFNLYSKYKKYDVKLKSGVYLLSPSMSSHEILTKIAGGDTERLDKKITIPEGYNLEQIANILERHGIVASEEFLNAATVDNFKQKYNFLEGVPEGQTLEGFLFPDTYYLSQGKSVNSYIDTFLKRFKQIYFEDNKLDEQQRLLGMSIYDVVILASIIEAEAKLDEERPIISGVFHNRLKIGMPLQSCATVEYALSEHKESLTLKDLEVDSPYNTYKHGGLPPGPIGAPGLSSLQAAVNPEPVEYLYFVAKGDGSHLFAKTLKEHVNNKNKVNK